MGVDGADGRPGHVMFWPDQPGPRPVIAKRQVSQLFGVGIGDHFVGTPPFLPSFPRPPARPATDAVEQQVKRTNRAWPRRERPPRPMTRPCWRCRLRVRAYRDRGRQPMLSLLAATVLTCAFGLVLAVTHHAFTVP